MHSAITVFNKLSWSRENQRYESCKHFSTEFPICTKCVAKSLYHSGKSDFHKLSSDFVLVSSCGGFLINYPTTQCFCMPCFGSNHYMNLPKNFILLILWTCCVFSKRIVFTNFTNLSDTSCTDISLLCKEALCLPLVHIDLSYAFSILWHLLSCDCVIITF